MMMMMAKESRRQTYISNLMLSEPTIILKQCSSMYAIMHCNVNQSAYLSHARVRVNSLQKSKPISQPVPVIASERENESSCSHNGKCDISHQSRKLMRFLLNLIYCCQWPFPCVLRSHSPFQFKTKYIYIFSVYVWHITYSSHNEPHFNIFDGLIEKQKPKPKKKHIKERKVCARQKKRELASFMALLLLFVDAISISTTTSKCHCPILLKA